MNKKELIKLLDKYEIEYEITDNTKEVEEGLRLLDEALEKIGIVAPKETQVDNITRENDPEVPKYTTEWASSDDTISRQAAMSAIYSIGAYMGRKDAMDTLKALPPIEPPKKVVAQIKVDIDELMERIKEEYEITDRPKGECRTCKRCSDHCCETDDDFTRCPIEEHYMLPKDGYCHLYDPISR